MSITRELVLACILSINLNPVSNQEKLTSINNCEANIAVLYDAARLSSKDTLIIAIARLGPNEKKRGLNHRRLHNVKLYLKEFCGHPLDKIILAEGARAKDYGKVELYINGKLIYEIKLGLQEDLYAGSCDGTSPKDRFFFDSRKSKSRYSR